VDEEGEVTGIRQGVCHSLCVPCMLHAAHYRLRERPTTAKAGRGVIREMLIGRELSRDQSASMPLNCHFYTTAVDCRGYQF